MKPRVLISTTSFGACGAAPLERLRRAGVEAVLNPHGRRLERAETVELLAGVAGLVAGTETLDRGVLEGASALEVVSRCGTGLDNVDLDAARELGIRVYSTPEAPVEAVAELTLAGILHLLRRLGEADRAVRRGTWSKPMGRLLAGKTVGIVGLGRIGKALARLLAPFRVELVAADPEPDAEFADRHGVEFIALEELLERSHIVSLHLDAGPRPPRLLDRMHLARMRPDAILVNCARGGLVDEEALAERLEEGLLAGAFLDVYEREPYRGPLAGLASVLLTPHIGSYAAESRLRMEVEAVENLLAGLGRRTPS